MNRRDSLKMMGAAAVGAAAAPASTPPAADESSGLYFGMCLGHYK